MTFRPGQSGNPAGRPKSYPEIVKLAREQGPAAIKKLTEIMNAKDSKKPEIAMAAEALLNRGFGKPSQSLTVLDSEDAPPVDQMTDEQIQAKLDALSTPK